MHGQLLSHLNSILADTPLYPLQNDRYLRSIFKQSVDKTPVWLMRQAGRYLPEYRRIRAEAGSFMDLCTNPELATEVTLQPLRRYELDAAILFSDILTVPDAMGLGLHFVAGEGPKFERPVSTAAEIAALPVPDPHEKLRYVVDAVSSIRHALKGHVPLIGFAGSPWTIATYMVEGGPSKDYAKTKSLCFNEPQVAHQLLQKITDATILYLNAQIAAGAQAVMVFDSWGGVLAPQDYVDFSLQYMAQITDSLTREVDGAKIPVTLFTKGNNMHLEKIAATGADCVGVDWTIDMAAAKARIGNKVALQGNLDPSILLANESVVRARTREILEAFPEKTGHVFNLGHGLTPAVPPASVAALVDEISLNS